MDGHIDIALHRLSTRHVRHKPYQLHRNLHLDIYAQARASMWTPAGGRLVRRVLEERFEFIGPGVPVGCGPKPSGAGSTAAQDMFIGPSDATWVSLLPLVSGPRIAPEKRHEFEQTGDAPHPIDCPVCLEPISDSWAPSPTTIMDDHKDPTHANRKVMIVPCGHHFHYGCLLRWAISEAQDFAPDLRFFEVPHRCPMCRHAYIFSAMSVVGILFLDTYVDPLGF